MSRDFRGPRGLGSALAGLRYWGPMGPGSRLGVWGPGFALVTSVSRGLVWSGSAAIRGGGSRCEYRRCGEARGAQVGLLEERSQNKGWQ